jgi:hypothetical protein
MIRKLQQLQNHLAFAKTQLLEGIFDLQRELSSYYIKKIMNMPKSKKKAMRKENS